MKITQDMELRTRNDYGLAVLVSGATRPSSSATFWRLRPAYYASKDHIDQLLDNPEEKMWFLAYLRAGILLPISIYHFVIAAWHLETYYLHRLGKRDETHFAVAFHDFYHDPSTKEVLEKMFAPTIEPFDANPRLRSSYTFARDPKDEKKMIFVNRVFFSSYMDFYVYD